MFQPLYQFYTQLDSAVARIAVLQRTLSTLNTT